jgi:hypothetical protein
LNIEKKKNILVIDFGAGTLDLALISTKEKTSNQGDCEVISKDGIPIGGNVVDAWIIEELCGHYSYNFDRLSGDPEIQWWYKILLNEARNLKEKLFFKKKETFYLMPSNIMKKYTRSIPKNSEQLKKPVDFTRTDLKKLLEKKGLYAIYSRIIASVIKSAEARGLKEESIDDVLMVGGSTLLPEIYSITEERFGRDRVRAWQPFNAVAFGAAVYGSGKYHKSDYITHDYAFITYNIKTHDPEHNIIVPRGTKYPTQQDFWKRQLTPTCALGEPENIFKLVVCEIGTRHSFDQEFIWDRDGELHLIDENTDENLIVPLNEDDPTLGYLKPPHYPSDKHARVEVSFYVNEEKWLCVNVRDLMTGKHLLIDKPVIRLK